MSIYQINEKHIEVTTLELNPNVSFVSGVSDPTHVYPFRSVSEKEILPPTSFNSSSVSEQTINSTLTEASQHGITSGNNSGLISDYFRLVNTAEKARKNNQTVAIYRIKPGYMLDQYWLMKSTIINTLIPHYKSSFSNCNFGYSNYNTLNFFTATTVPSNSVLLYPQTVTSASGELVGQYIPNREFSFDFWINPRYKESSTGTILHLSSCYSVSLVSGSSRDINGLVDKYRLLLQVSSSTDVSPSSINLSALPEFAFVSNDNVLNHNTWNHITIRWGTSDRNFGTGSFVVNGNNEGNFVIPSSSIIPSSGSPTVLCVGNYYEGTNTGVNGLSYFFTSDIATREGLLELTSDSGLEPAEYQFNHPLNAEIHDLKIYNKYLNNTEVNALESFGPALIDSNLLFYVPPLFVSSSTTRTNVLTTPFFETTGTTTTPFSREIAFEVGGHYINLENFVKDLAGNNHPRLLNLTGSAIVTPSPTPKTANVLLNENPNIVKRNLTILPCDNGRFYPNYQWISENDGWIDLGTIYDESFVFSGLADTEITNSLSKQVIGPDPNDLATLSTEPSTVPSILQRTKDGTSSQVSIYDISNLYYGERIKQNTITLRDNSISGSDGKISITLKDNGNGGLYRSDCSGSVATWANVGTVFYNEGLLFVKSPHLYWHGESGFSVSFKGVQHTHVQKIKAIAQAQQVFSSSNPTYTTISASSYAADTTKDFIYISDVLLMDKNLNVVMRSTLSQPIKKRFDEQIGFVIQQDW